MNNTTATELTVAINGDLARVKRQIVMAEGRIELDLEFQTKDGVGAETVNDLHLVALHLAIQELKKQMDALAGPGPKA